MNKKLKLILILILCIAAFIGLFVFNWLNERIKMNPPGTIGNTAGNLNNGGLFCEYNGRVYFSNTYDKGSLYSMAPDETDMKKLNSAQVSNLTAGGSYVYYYQMGISGKSGLGYLRSPYGIYRTTLNGKSTACLYQGTLRNYQLVDNYIYYLTKGENSMEFSRVKIDGSETALLSTEPVNPACAVDGSIYYNGTSSNHYLYRMDGTTGSVSTVWEGNLWYPMYSDGYIYYLDVADNYCLSRYSLNDNLVEKLTADRVDCFNVGGGYIYYQKNSADAPALMKMNTDGSGVETVAEGNYTKLNMTSRYVYFQEFGNEISLFRVMLGGTDVAPFDTAKTLSLENM